jgi:hypothetical protein
VPGVTGVIAVSEDGLVIAAQTGLGDRAAEEAGAAVLGNLGRALEAAAERLGRGAFRQLVVSGAGGRAVRLYALNPNGTRREEVPGRAGANGGASFAAGPQNQTLWYELVIGG